MARLFGPGKSRNSKQQQMERSSLFSLWSRNLRLLTTLLLLVTIAHQFKFKDNIYRALVLESPTLAPSGSTKPGFRRDYYDVCVVGAGLSGAVIAEQYASQLGKSSLIVEKRNHIGGNCYDYVDPHTGILVNLYGAHLFHTNYHRVWQYIQQFADWEPYQHRVLAKVGDKHVPVPVNIDTVNALFDANIQSPAQMQEWLKQEQVRYNQDPKNSEEMALSRVGQRLYDLIFKPYTFKQWAKYPIDLGPEVTARIPVRDTYDDRYFNDNFQALPSKGYTAWFQEIFRKNRDLIEVHTNVDYFRVRDQMQSLCGKLFYTGPVDAYFAHLGWEKLEYRSLQFERVTKENIGENQFALPASVVNYPSADYNFTRIVEYKHFLDQKSNHAVLFKETSSDKGEPYYPVPNRRNQDLYQKYQSMAMQEANVTFVGRLANYKYFNMDQSIWNALKVFDQSAPKVVVEQVNGKSGGHEALVQLALAFFSWMPTRTFVDGNGLLRHWTRWYPTLGEIPKMNKKNLKAGDVLIFPEAKKCPTHLTQKGVRVFIWWLGYEPDNIVMDSIQKGCEFISHNFWLSHALGVKVPSSHVLLPYMNPDKSASQISDGTNIDNTKREELVIVNGHDNMRSGELQAIKGFCETNNRCTVQAIKGFDNAGLVQLYSKAKIVVAMCMRGSERCPIEAALGGVVVVSNPCQSATDTRDFPIPQENIITPKNPAPLVVERILNNFESEQQRMEGMRHMYKNLGPSTLEQQTKKFMFALDKVKSTYTGNTIRH